MANYISICPDFCDFLIGWMSTSPNDASSVLLSPNLNPQEPYSARYSIHIFTEIIRKSAGNDALNKPVLAGANIRDI